MGFDFNEMVDKKKKTKPSKQVAKEDISKMLADAEKLTDKPMVNESVLPTANKPKEVFEPEINTDAKPSVKILTALFKNDQWAEKSIHCDTWAKDNSYNFLGFCANTHEPMFKEVSV